MKQAHSIETSPVGKARMSGVAFENGELRLKKDARRVLALKDIVLASGETTLMAEGKAGPSLISMARYSRYAHSAIFAEVTVARTSGRPS